MGTKMIVFDNINQTAQIKVYYWEIRFGETAAIRITNKLVIQNHVREV